MIDNHMEIILVLARAKSDPDALICLDAMTEYDYADDPDRIQYAVASAEKSGCYSVIKPVWLAADMEKIKAVLAPADGSIRAEVLRAG